MTFYRNIPQPIPAMSVGEGETLYIILDGGQIPTIERVIYEHDENPDFEPVYLYEPWNVLRDASPYVVVASAGLIKWFFEHNMPTHGYFVASSLNTEALTDVFRRLIKVNMPYGGDVFYKLGLSEAAWVLFETDQTIIWSGINQVWVPTREGWKIKASPFSTQSFSTEEREATEWYTLSDQQLTLLGEVRWRNTIESLYDFLAKFYPEVIDKESDPYQWISNKAEWAYSKGFTTERDLMLYFYIQGEYDKHSIKSGQYPDIEALIHETSILTPSQRIEKAADLLSKKIEKDSTDD